MRRDIDRAGQGATVRTRLRRGWNGEVAITKRVRVYGQKIIDLSIELRDMFAPFWGEWHVGDNVFELIYRRHGVGVITAINLRTNDMDVHFDEVDRIFSLDDKDLAWLPLPIDLVNPKRGLWEMVDWDKLGSISIHNGLLTLLNSEGGLLFHGNSIEALLLALKAQKEGK